MTYLLLAELWDALLFWDNIIIIHCYNMLIRLTIIRKCILVMRQFLIVTRQSLDISQ